MKLKIIIVVLVALLSAIFFWQTTNRFLYPSRATEPTIVTPGGSSTTTGSTPGTTCAQRAKGDYTCDGKIDLADFDLFRREFTGVLTTKESDGNGDGVVSLPDFDILRRGMFP